MPDEATKSNLVIFRPGDVLAKCEYAKFNEKASAALRGSLYEGAEGRNWPERHRDGRARLKQTSALSAARPVLTLLWPSVLRHPDDGRSGSTAWREPWPDRDRIPGNARKSASARLSFYLSIFGKKAAVAAPATLDYA